MWQQETKSSNHLYNWKGKGLFLLIFLLVPDLTSAECMCNLTYTSRQTRNVQVENYAKEYIHNFTANTTQYLLTKTSKLFNLTAQLANYTKNYPTLGDYVLVGGLTTISWTNISSNYELMNKSLQSTSYKTSSTLVNTTLNSTFSCCCGFTNLSLSDYLSNCYFDYLERKLRETGANFSYPLGVYNSWGERNYTYESIDATTYSPNCICSVHTGFSYELRVEINTTTHLPLQYYDKFTVDGRLMMRDLELSVDNAISEILDQLYIQSDFERWHENLQKSVFFITLYFKEQYTNSLTYANLVNSSIIKLKFLPLRFSRVNVTLVAPPIITNCSLYINHVPSQCFLANPLPPKTDNFSFTNISGTNITIEEPAPIIPETLNIISESLYITEEVIVNITDLIAESTSLPSVETHSPPTPTSLNTTVTIPPTINSTEVPRRIEDVNSTIISNSNGTSSTQTITASYSTPNQPVLNGQTITIAIPALNPVIKTVPTLPTQTITPTATSPAANSTVAIQKNPNNSTFSTNVHTLPSQTNPTTSRNIQSSSTTASQATTKVPASTIPFDDDPFFKREVPILKRIYNDPKLVKRMEGTAASLTQESYFYTIAIPAAIGIIAVSILLLAFCQVDWIGSLAQTSKDKAAVL